MNIRLAHNEDMQAIVDLHVASWRENYHEVLSTEFLETDIENERFKVWQDRFSPPDSGQLILIAEEDDNQFIGFICAFGNFDQKHGTIIDNLHVKPEQKGKGIGGLLLKAASNWANEHFREMGLYLEVLKINSKAEAFYKSKGAQKLGKKVWQTPCGNSTDEFLYGWRSPAEFLKLNQ